MTDYTAARIAWISQTVSDSYPLDLDPEAHEWRRAMKMGEEAGEAFRAIAGALGENPRKGITHTPQDIDEEVLDVALSALAYWEHRHGDQGGSLDALRAHTLSRATRLRAALRPAVEGSAP